MTEKRWLAVIIFADICGFSSIMEYNESHARKIMGFTLSYMEKE